MQIILHKQFKINVFVLVCNFIFVPLKPGASAYENYVV